MHREVAVNRHHPPSTLTRLVLDTMACLRAAQSELCHGNKARAAMWLFSGVDLAHDETAPALLCNMDRSLREVEHELRLRDRPFSAKKVRTVWEQVRLMRQRTTAH